MFEMFLLNSSYLFNMIEWVMIQGSIVTFSRYTITSIIIISQIKFVFKFTNKWNNNSTIVSKEKLPITI